MHNAYKPSWSSQCWICRTGEEESWGLQAAVLAPASVRDKEITQKIIEQDIPSPPQTCVTQYTEDKNDFIVSMKYDSGPERKPSADENIPSICS